MGCIYEWNWILKLNHQQIPDLKIGVPFTFYKKGIRIFPINIPIDLVNENWESIARCVITSVTMEKEETKGIYQIVNIYDDAEREIMTKMCRDMLCYATNDYTIGDFSKKHIT